MNKIAALTAYLLSLNLVDENNLESWIEKIDINPEFCADGDFFIACTAEYVAQFRFYDYPHKRVSAMVLFTYVSLWLQEHDADRTIPFKFPADIDAIETANIDFGIEFLEVSRVIESATGDMTFNGKTYSQVP